MELDASRPKKMARWMHPDHGEKERLDATMDLDASRANKKRKVNASRLGKKKNIWMQPEMLVATRGWKNKVVVASTVM